MIKFCKLTLLVFLFLACKQKNNTALQIKQTKENKWFFTSKNKDTIRFKKLVIPMKNFPVKKEKIIGVTKANIRYSPNIEETNSLFATSLKMKQNILGQVSKN